MNRPIRGLAYEVAHVREDVLYFAVRHGRHDGHDRVMEAVSRGAGAVVCERGGFIPPRAVSIRVRDTRQALAQAAAVFHGHPSQALDVIGVTGTGATADFAFLLGALLDRADAATGWISSLQHRVGDRLLPPRPEGEESLEIQRMLASMLRHGQRRAVLELGETARAHGWSTGLELRELIQLCPAETPATPDLVFPAQSAWRVVWSDQEHVVRVISADAVFRLGVYRLTTTLEGISLRLRTPWGLKTVHAPLVGGRQARRLVGVLAVAAALGVPWSRLTRAARRLPSVPGRLEPVSAGQSFAVWVDGAESPVELARLLRETRALAPRRILLLVGGHAGQSATERRRLGRVAALGADRVLVTSHNPRTADPAELAAEVRAGARMVRAGTVEEEPDRATAIARLLDLAQPGDVVLLTGKGHRVRQELDHCVIPFDDRTQARRLLEQRDETADAKTFHPYATP
jgi:UDP-N-acetylmuramoyl-L-alanyl-D-glutamate--2,6-diaminopimelate ligase